MPARNVRYELSVIEGIRQGFGGATTHSSEEVGREILAAYKRAAAQGGTVVGDHLVPVELPAETDVFRGGRDRSATGRSVLFLVTEIPVEDQPQDAPQAQQAHWPVTYHPDL